MSEQPPAHAAEYDSDVPDVDLLEPDFDAEDTDEVDELVEDATCQHCGSGPDADGDHTCPCPHPDATCPDHPTEVPA